MERFAVILVAVFVFILLAFLVVASSHAQYSTYIKITGNPHNLTWWEYESVRKDLLLIPSEKTTDKVEKQ